MARKGDRDVAVPAAEADLGLAEAGIKELSAQQAAVLAAPPPPR